MGDLDSSVRSPEPLAEHRLMQTEDVDEARQVVTDVYVPHDLDTAGGRPLDARLNVVASPLLTLVTVASE